jgi:hypothetical protein
MTILRMPMVPLAMTSAPYCRLCLIAKLTSWKGESIANLATASAKLT